MKIWLKVLIIVIIILIAIGIIALINAYLSSDIYEEHKAMKNENLTEYTYSTGGDMIGSHYSQDINLLDDTHAILSILSAEWHSDDGKVEEYIIDSKVLKEIEEIFRKNHMNRWAHRKITDLFVADGASYSYSFTFGDTNISFSSQYYPNKYSKHLKEIDEIIDKYSKNKEKLPGLVITETNNNNDEWIPNTEPTPGKITFTVYRYIKNYLYCRIINGTKKTIQIPNQLFIFDSLTNNSIPAENSTYETNYDIEENGYHELYIKINEQLNPGNYTVKCGDYSTDFVIE